MTGTPGWSAAVSFAVLSLFATAAFGAAATAAHAKAGKNTPAASASASSTPAAPACVARLIAPTEAGGVSYLQECAEAPLMAVFRGGSFNMGDPFGNGLAYERPMHEVHLRAYALSRTEVTVAQWQACVKANACGVVGSAIGNGHLDLPVSGVSWDQAQDYVHWLAKRTGKPYRLPSEAEWEYAARAGSQDQFTWGNQVANACRYANSFDQAGVREHPQWNWNAECDDGFPQLAPVASFPPNAWGLYDMLGNVWEWVQDCWHSDYTGAPTDGSAWMSGDCSKHVNRGGGWGNHPRSLRVSTRDGDVTDARSDGLGFRVARDIDLPAK